MHNAGFTGLWERGQERLYSSYYVIYSQESHSQHCRWETSEVAYQFSHDLWMKSNLFHTLFFPRLIKLTEWFSLSWDSCFDPFGITSARHCQNLAPKRHRSKTDSWRGFFSYSQKKNYLITSTEELQRNSCHSFASKFSQTTLKNGKNVLTYFTPRGLYTGFIEGYPESDQK